jgi:hypothetical protein
MLDNPTKEKQIEIAVRLFDNNTYGTTYGKGLYRRAVFNGTIDARSPTAKYLVDCYNYEDWCNIASTDQQITVLEVIPADSRKLYSWIKHYDTVTRAKRLVGGCMQFDLDSLDMNIMICDETAGVADHWRIEGKPCKTAMKSQKSPQILGTNADLTNW